MTIDLRSFPTSDETTEALTKLSKVELHLMAEELELIGHKSWSKDYLIHKIVFFGRTYPMTLEYMRNVKVKLYTGVTMWDKGFGLHISSPFSFYGNNYFKFIECLM